MSSTSTGDDRSVNVTSDRRSADPAGRQLALTTRPRHRSASPRDGTNDMGGGGPGCTLRGRRLAPAEMQTVSGARRRFNSMSATMMARPVVTKRTGDESARRLRVSRDATQPATGSMRSLRSSSQDSDEEADEFPERSFVCSVSGTSLPLCGRPRAATCPESKAFRRRARVRSFNRPPTPTPTPAGTDTDSPATADGEGDGDCGSAQRLADLRLSGVGYAREPTNGRSVTKSPSLGNCGADLPAISESQ